MTICIFPGTFNPIHNAHIRVAEFALEKFGFKKIIFIPSFIPPQKDIDKNLANHRFEMVKLATKHNSKFEVSDIEYKREEKSYSLITVKKIKELYTIDGKVNFLIGTDAFINLKTWYKIDELKELVHFIVFKRCKNFNPDDYNYYKNHGFDYEFTDLEFFDISSTEVRNNSKANSINQEVREYIDKNGLYR